MRAILLASVEPGGRDAYSTCLPDNVSVLKTWRPAWVQGTRPEYASRYTGFS